MSEHPQEENKFEITISKKNLLTGALVLVAVIVVIGMVVMKSGALENTDTSKLTEITSNVSEIGGKQVIDLTVRGGYRPNVTVAKSGKPTELKLNTSNTFDCSASVNIPQLKFSENLPTTGTKEIQIPAQEVNAVINGACSMGMYGFRIKFI